MDKLSVDLKELTRPDCSCGGYWNGQFWEHAKDCRTPIDMEELDD